MAAPRAPIKDAGNGGEQHVAPVEKCGALVEVRQAEEDGRGEEGACAADAPLQQILEPSPKKKFLRHSNEEEREDPRTGELEQHCAAWESHGVQVKKAQFQP